MYKLCVFPCSYSWFSPLILLFTFFLGEIKKYGHYCLLWVLNGYDSAWKTQCLLNMSFKHYFGSYFGWNLSIRKTKIQLGKLQEIKGCLFSFWSTKLLWDLLKNLSFLKERLNGNGVYKWAYAASRAAHPHTSIYVLLIDLLAEKSVYFALLCSL